MYKKQISLEGEKAAFSTGLSKADKAWLTATLICFLSILYTSYSCDFEEAYNENIKNAIKNFQLIVNSVLLLINLIRLKKNAEKKDLEKVAQAVLDMQHSDRTENKVSRFKII